MEKSKYFTSKNLRKKSDAFFCELIDKFKIHSDRINIGKSALLILDMQRFFHDEDSHAFIPSAKAIVRPIIQLADLFNRNNRPIILTKHINTLENAKMMNYWWRDILTDDSKFSEMIPDIQNVQYTEIITKTQYDAFYKTNLDDLLQKLKVEQVVITGVMTHLCCETTARSAFVHGYNVFLPIDGTATYNEDIHLASLTILAHGFVNVTTTSNLNDKIL
jgi:nicotinamidase-related amidase